MRVFSYWGVSEVIHTDQGVQFESDLMRYQCRLWGTTLTHTTPYHPQTNGVVKRGNRALGDSLRALLLDQNPTDWDKVLQQIMRTFRGMLHSKTRETANFFMMGREARLPDTLRYNPMTN